MYKLVWARGGEKRALAAHLCSCLAYKAYTTSIVVVTGTATGTSTGLVGSQQSSMATKARTRVILYHTTNDVLSRRLYNSRHGGLLSALPQPDLLSEQGTCRGPSGTGAGGSPEAGDLVAHHGGERSGLNLLRSFRRPRRLLHYCLLFRRG